jgi:anti-anti-sigma regulatory factor
MNNLKIQVLTNEKGLVNNLSIGGSLVVENAQNIKQELTGILKQLNDSVQIEINEVDNIDLSFIQLMISFTLQLNEKGIKFKLNWNLDEDHRLLFENVGLSNELFMND